MQSKKINFVLIKESNNISHFFLSKMSNVPIKHTRIDGERENWQLNRIEMHMKIGWLESKFKLFFCLSLLSSIAGGVSM